MKGVVLSLCDRTGIMVQPWLDAGYGAVTVDLQNASDVHPMRHHIVADVKTWFYPIAYYGKPAAVFAFPPCTHLAVSGARWFRDKGLRRLIDALAVVDACREICETSGAPWMIENPVSVLASYWREPDHVFQPHEYGDPYMKRTCVWCGNGFVMPPIIKPGDMFDEPTWTEPTQGSIMHVMGPRPDRGDQRSVTSPAFARAVFAQNSCAETGKTTQHNATQEQTIFS